MAWSQQRWSVDMPDTTTRDFGGFNLMMVRGFMFLQDTLRCAFAIPTSSVILGPRNGARSVVILITVPLSSDIPEMDAIARQVDSLRSDITKRLEGWGQITGNREVLDAEAVGVLQTKACELAAICHGVKPCLAAGAMMPSLTGLSSGRARQYSLAIS